MTRTPEQTDTRKVKVGPGMTLTLLTLDDGRSIVTEPEMVRFHVWASRQQADTLRAAVVALNAAIAEVRL